MEFKEKLQAYAKRVESSIDTFLPKEDTRPARIHTAMRYSINAGGKRLRPILALEANRIFGGTEDAAMPAAIAIECIHTYSLIHDDLPSIDNADLRRGCATCHIEFDEPTAILAGDALLTFAFQLIGRHYSHTPEIGMHLLSLIGETAGSEHLIGGQMEDILGEEAELSAEELEYIHLNKTSQMIESSLEMGALIGGADSRQRDAIRAYGRNIGLMFQVVDDILDATSDESALGKNVRIDIDNSKTTYVSLHGLEGARAIADKLTEDALRNCALLSGDTSFLCKLTEYLSNRLS